MFTQGVHIVCIEYMHACLSIYVHTVYVVCMYLNTYDIYIFKYLPCHPFNIFWMPQLPTKRKFSGMLCFFLKTTPGELALGDDSEALKPVTENPGKTGEMVDLILPIPSMHGIFTYIWFIFMVNVGKYTIHGSYGLVFLSFGEMLLIYLSILEKRDPEGC